MPEQDRELVTMTSRQYFDLGDLLAFYLDYTGRLDQWVTKYQKYGYDVDITLGDKVYYISVVVWEWI